MHPFIFSSLPLRWENGLIILGILAALWLARKRASHKGEAYQEMLLDLTLWLVPAGLVGGRLWDVLFTWDSYKVAPWNALAVWDGGMSIQGTVLGGLLTALLFARRRGIRAWDLLDILAPSVLLGQAIGRVGCLLSGDAFGRPIQEIPWMPSWLGVVYAPNSPAGAIFGRTPLVPAEAFEAVADLVILFVLLNYRPRLEVPGRTTLVYAILYSLARFGLEWFRADSLEMYGYKVPQLLSAGVILLAAVLLIGRYRRSGGVGALELK